jgi:hypothetical protein
MEKYHKNEAATKYVIHRNVHPIAASIIPTKIIFKLTVTIIY